jgi:oligopeptide transport system substrate-binding protein
MLKVVSQVTEEELIETLDRAEKLQLIQDLRSRTRLLSSLKQESHDSELLRSPGFSFTHALIHSTLLSTRSTLRRQRHQRQVAISLAEAFPDRTSELAPLLGRYFAEGNEAQRAVPYLLQSGDAARRIFAFEEAAQAYEHAVLLLGEMQEFRLAASTLMKLGLVYYNSHNFDQARRTYAKAFELRQLSGKVIESIGDKLPEAPHALRLNLGSPISLDPSRVTDALSQIVTEQIYSVLIGIGAEGELIPDIARSWQIYDGGRKYVFTLRNDVLWSDGEPLTAHDFEFGWKRTLDPAFGRQQALSLYDVRGAKEYNSGVVANSDSVGVSAVDSTTLEVELAAPTGYFLYLLNSSAAMPVPQHAVLKYGDAWTDDDNIVTSGPFLLKRWERDKYIRLAKNPTYRGSFGGNINQVTMRLEPDATALESLYLSDELDMLYMFTLPTDVHERMRQRYTSEYLIAPALYTLFINFDPRRPPFDDARIRQAFVLATDRGAVADIILKGFSIPATGGMVPPGMPGHVEGIARGYHPELARDLLAQAGYPDGNGFPEIHFMAPAFGAFPFADEALLDQWHQTLGVKIKIERMAFGELLKEVRNRIPNIWRMVWTADYPDPDNFLRVGTWLADGGWQSQEYNQLVTKARVTSAEGERLSMYRKAEEMLVKESPVLPLTYGRYQFLLKPWLKHFPIVGMHVTSWKDAILEPHS